MRSWKSNSPSMMSPTNKVAGRFFENGTAKGTSSAVQGGGMPSTEQVLDAIEPSSHALEEVTLSS